MEYDDLVREAHRTLGSSTEGLGYALLAIADRLDRLGNLLDMVADEETGTVHVIVRHFNEAYP